MKLLSVRPRKKKARETYSRTFIILCLANEKNILDQTER